MAVDKMTLKFFDRLTLKTIGCQNMLILAIGTLATGNNRS